MESAGQISPDQAQVFNLGGNNLKKLLVVLKRLTYYLYSIPVIPLPEVLIFGHERLYYFSKNNAKSIFSRTSFSKMATNEIVDDETLGGAEMHSKISGVSDYLAQDEFDGIRIA